MTTLQVFKSGTDELVDTITVTEAGDVDYATGAGRPMLEALTEQYARRGVTIPTDQVAEALDGWSDGSLELFAPDALVDVVVPNVLADVREAMGSDAGELKTYWVAGAGSRKVRWGSSGDFKRCVRHLGKYVTDPKGLCNTYHQAALGAPPGKGH